MFGKQGWRLCTNTESLVNKVFKACYFSDWNFLNAKLGNNPSYVWRSVLESQSLIKRGGKWMAATGEKVNIFDQPWLENEGDPYISTRSQVLQQNKVSSLICSEGKNWDVDIIKDHLMKEIKILSFQKSCQIG